MIDDTQGPEVLCDLRARTILLTGEINEGRAQDFRESLLELHGADPTNEIIVFIDTYGGSPYAMFAMHDMMKLMPFPIHTVGIGKVMSAGVVLLAAGEKRSVTPNAIIMMHQMNTEVQGKLSSAQAECAHVELLQNRMYELYSKYTGHSIEKISEDLQHNKYMTAEEAIKYGLADDIFPIAKK